ncbi:MAG: hypothetical protein V4537_17220 [Pseudomonadota bacterium]
MSLAAAVAAAWAVAPAMGAEDGRAAPRRIAVPTAGIGSFTPASGDPRLAAVLARAGISGNGFRFTPSGAGKTGARAVTVAVRARSNRGAAAAAEPLATGAAPVALAPIAYNLGVAVGWKRFALSGDLAKVDLAGQPGSRESADLGVSYTGAAFSGRVKAEAARPLANQPRLIADQPSYSIDVGGAYSITRNLDVTAGVRYKSERERLPQLTDTRRDSQSVYVGTAFRF